MKTVTISIIAFICAPLVARSMDGSRIPPEIVENIAKATLPLHHDLTTLTNRIESVKYFLSNNGGDTIYRNYLAEFALGKGNRYCEIPSDVNDARLGYYYLTQGLDSPKAAIGCFGYDSFENALTVTNSNPTLQAQYALAHWDAFILSGDSKYAAETLKAADYFTAVIRDGQVQWTNRTIPAHGITSTPWISALTQGQTTSVLLRAWQHTGQQKYKDAADSTYRWLTVPVGEGGVQSSDIGIWLEEYPAQNGLRSSHVLNGTIFAAFGVWDYYRATGDTNAEALFQQNLEAIKANIKAYDLGYWIVYSQLNRDDTVSGLYMQFIVLQMYALGKISGDPYWTELGDKWNNYQREHTLFVHNTAKVYLTWLFSEYIKKNRYYKASKEPIAQSF
jgi:hypothetical protein